MFARVKSGERGNLILELLMLVAGINIALWFEGWFEELQERDTEQQYLQGLYEDLATDIEELEILTLDAETKIKQLSGMIPDIAELMNVDKQRRSDILFAPSSYLFFSPSDFTYQSMQESGDFRLISDHRTKQDLLKLVRLYQHIETLETNFLQALDDGYIPLMMGGFDILEQEITNPEAFDTIMLKNFFAFTYQETSGRQRAYKNALARARALQVHIDAQINKRS